MRTWCVGMAMLAMTGSAMPAEAKDTVVAASAPPASLTLARVFASPDLAGPQPRALKLSPDGSLITFLRNRSDEKDRYDLWATDTRTGESRMLVDSRKVGTGADLSEAEKMQRERARIGGQRGIVTYDWTPDGSAILVPLDGDLFLATLDGTVRRLTAMPGGQLNPAISPKSGYVSFVRAQNLLVQPLAGGAAGTHQSMTLMGPGAAQAVTTGGAGTVHWGEAEFVAQEEMDRRTGYWWSPDERHIAIERFDEAPVGVVTRAAIGANGTSVYDQRYPAAGTPNVLVELYVTRPDGTGQVKVDLGSNPDIYLARVDWTPDGRTLLVQRESRDQKTLDMLRVDAATGRSVVLFSEHASLRGWINLSDAYRAMADGSLIWSSERDGYRHLYRFADGKWTQLTHGAWSVRDLIGVNETGARAYFTANKDDVLEQHVYALDLHHPDAVTLLTERGWVNDGTMDTAATRLIVSRSNTGQPAQTYLADPSGKRIAWINQNSVADPVHPYHAFVATHQPTRFGTTKAADGTTLHWEMITPKLEPGRRYPVFFQHYGGPTLSVVTRGWGGALAQYLVSRGWIYFQIDNRGTPGRGKAFEETIYRAMGSVEVADQLAGANYLKTLPFIDPGRIAIYGWSYGGYMTLKMLEANPGVYAAGVSGAPVTKWELYDTHYTERYMGDPRTDGAAYTRSDALTDALAIRDPLLLVHGMSDDNVVFENSTMFAAKMQAGGRPFEMMFYPGYTHRVAGPGISEHLWGTILAFLDREVVNKPAR